MRAKKVKNIRRLMNVDLKKLRAEPPRGIVHKVAIFWVKNELPGFKPAWYTTKKIADKIAESLGGTVSEQEIERYTVVNALRSKYRLVKKLMAGQPMSSKKSRINGYPTPV